MVLRNFLADMRERALPISVRNQVRLLLLDLIGTGFGATDTNLHRIITPYAADHLGGDRARILFTDRRSSAEGAALAGGMTIDALDAHDGHRLAKGHVGCGLLPALLAVRDREALPLTGEEFSALLAAGYEIGTRCGISLHESVPDYHTSGAWNAVGCAAVAGHLLGLEEESFRHAIGIAEYHGPRSQMMRGIDHPSMVKDGSGWGAMAGVSAAYLAKAGFTGAPAITVESPIVAGIWNDLGERWRILEQYVKGFPVCRWAQPAIQAALDLQGAHTITADTISSVRVETFHQAVRLLQGVPADTEQAQYAITFPIAAALVRGEVGAAEVHPDAFTDPAILAMMQRIEIVESVEYSQKFPAERWARMTIALSDGRVVTSDPTEALGDPDKPYDRKAIIEKFHRLAGTRLSIGSRRGIIAAIDGLDGSTSSLDHLSDLIFAAPDGPG